MTTLKNTLATFAKTTKKHIADFAIAAIIYAALLVILSIPVMVITGQIAPPADSISSILERGIEKLQSGYTLAKSLSPEEIRILSLSASIYFVGATLVKSFFLGGFINMAVSGGTIRERLSVFFSKGLALTPRMVSMSLLLAAFIVFIIMAGAIVGLIVYPAAVLFVLASGFIAVFFAIRLQLAPFGFALTKKPVMETLISSYETSAPFFWVIAGISFVIYITFWAMSNLAGRIIGLTELIMSIETIVTLMLLLPVYTEATNRKMENA